MASEQLFSLVSEFGGGTVEHIFAEGLTADSFKDPDNPNDKPMFVTLPIIKVGEKSVNGLRWERPDAERVVSEVNTKRVEGGLGHTPADKRATDYKLPVLRWVGAKLMPDGTVMATAYVPNYATDVREFFRDAKRAKARVGTSVYGERGSLGLRDMKLENIDIGHPDRVSLRSAAAIPNISEFEEQNEMGDQDTLIAELRTDRDKARTEATDYQTKLNEAKKLIESLEKDSGSLKLVAELAGTTPDRAVETVKGLVAELTLARKKQAAEQRFKLVAEMVAPDEKNRALPQYQQLARLVATQIGEPADDEAARKAVAEYMKTDDYKDWAQRIVAELAGPNAFRGNGGDNGNWRDELAKKGPELAKQMGAI